MGRSEKRGLASRLKVLLAHLLKWQHQPGNRGNSWRLTIEEQRREVTDHLADNPSLKDRLPEAIASAYPGAVLVAARETGLGREIFPAACPWSFNKSLPTTSGPATGRQRALVPNSSAYLCGITAIWLRKGRHAMRNSQLYELTTGIRPSLSVMAARVFNRSRVVAPAGQAASPSTSPGCNASIMRRSCAVGLGSADMQVAEHLLASRPGQLPCLCVSAFALAARRYPRVAVFHWIIVQRIICSKNIPLFSAAYFCCEIFDIRKCNSRPARTE